MKTHTTTTLATPHPLLVRFEQHEDSLKTQHNNLISTCSATTTASVDATLDYARFVYDTAVSFQDDRDVMKRFRTLIGMTDKTKFSQFRTIGQHADALRTIRDTLPSGFSTLYQVAQVLNEPTWTNTTLSLSDLTGLHPHLSHREMRALIRDFKQTHGFPVVPRATRAARVPQVTQVPVQTHYTCSIQLDGEEDNVRLWDALIRLLTQHGCDPSCSVTIADASLKTLFRERVAHATQQEQRQRDAERTLARTLLVSDAA
jgi:hypothetical protein